MSEEIAPTALRIANDARAINRLFLSAMRDSASAFEKDGCVGLAKETACAIAALSDESAEELGKVSVPLVVLVNPDADANTAVLDISGEVAARWGALAASVAAFSRSGIHYRGNSMRLVLGSRCSCEWEMSEQDLSGVLGNPTSGVSGLRSRFRDNEWEAMLRGAREGGEAADGARTYANQVLSGTRGCPGCPGPHQRRR